MNYAISIIVLILLLGGIWLLGTSEKNPEWSTGQVRENVSQLVRKEKSSDSPLQQTINISLDHPAQQEPAGTVHAVPAADNLRSRIEPDSSDPTRSWSTEAKVARPVEYMNQVLAYLKKRRVELRNMRFDVGTTLQEWELKKKRSSRNVKGCEAVLREAVAAYQKAEAENSWPVDFAYRDYSKEEMQTKLYDCRSNLEKAEQEDQKISQGLDLLRNTSQEQDYKIRQLEKEIQLYEDNLELIRSGKINSEIADFMKKLDKTVADRKQIHEENLQTAEREIFLPAKTRQRETEESLENILRDFGAEKK